MMSSFALSVCAAETGDEVGYINGDPVPYVTPAHNPNGGTATFSASSCPNYATSTETIQFWYDGYIQFQPGYLTTSYDGSGLQANKHVRRASIDYMRNDSSVSNEGRQYTETAESPIGNQIYSASVSATDSIFDWGDTGTTSFYRWWYYF
jgi:hypothetical protein